jgi:HPr kinase/phosphorylase
VALEAHLDQRRGLFEAHREACAGSGSPGTPTRAPLRRRRRARRPVGADLVGYLNYIHPYRVQIVGRREVAYLADASP